MSSLVLILIAALVGSPWVTRGQGYGRQPHPQQGYPQRHPQQQGPHPQQGPYPQQGPQPQQGPYPQQGPPPCEHESYDPTGTYESPGYPEGYRNNLECKYRFFTDKIIDVMFEAFDLESTRDCTYDYLNVVFDAISPDAKPERYCGEGLENINGGNISGKGPLVMIFVSDDSTVFSGFKFTYQFQIHGPDMCLSEPCQNGGTCERLVDDYRCLCEPGFAGHHCELDVDECASHPCKHGGGCQDQLLGYTCNCINRFTGEDCEIPPDRCESEPCYNDAICVSRTMDFVCSCPVTHEGDLCEIQVPTTPPPTTTTTTLPVTTTAVPNPDEEADSASNKRGRGGGDGIEIEPITNEETTGSSGAAAAAVIICLVALALVAVLAWYWFKQQRKSRDAGSEGSIMGRKKNSKEKTDKPRVPPEHTQKSKSNTKHFDLLNELQRISQEIIMEENDDESPRRKKKHKHKSDETKARRHNKSDQIMPDNKIIPDAQGLKSTKNIDLSPEDAARMLNQLLGKKRPRHEISPQEARLAMEHVWQRKAFEDYVNPSILSSEERDSNNHRKKRLKGRQARSIQKIPNHSPIQEESVTQQVLRKNGIYDKNYLQPQNTLDPGRKVSAWLKGSPTTWETSKGLPTIETEDESDSSLSGPQRGHEDPTLVETDMTLEDFEVNEVDGTTEIRSAFKPIHRNPYNPPPLPVTENKAKSLVDKLVRPPVRSNENVVGHRLGVQRQKAFMD